MNDYLSISTPYYGEDLEPSEDSDWLIVGPDAYHYRYPCDDDRRAIDETNRDVIVDAYPDDFRTVDRTLQVRSDSDGHAHALECIAALANYPLLDKSAYDERDADAWRECWTDWAAGEVWRDVMVMLIDAGLRDEWALEYLGYSDVWHTAALEGMSYYYGLRGEYDSEGAVDAVLEYVAGALRLCDVLSDMARPLAGVFPLPFPA